MSKYVAYLQGLDRVAATERENQTAASLDFLEIQGTAADLENGSTGLATDSPFGEVYDGDTTRSATHRVRFEGGDTAEINTSGKDAGSAEPLSIEAQQRTRELLLSGKYVERDSGKKDHHGRVLGNYVDEEGNTIMEQLLREGLATPTNFNKNSINNHLAFAESVDAAENGTLQPPKNAIDYGEVTIDQSTHVRDYRNFAQRAVDKGIDKTQMNLYQFTELVGEMAGVDLMKEWGEEGVIRNMIEASKSPSEFDSYEDVDTSSIESIGRYVIEKTLENAPNIATDIGIGAAAIASGVGIPAAIALATGRSFIKKIGWRAAGKAGLVSSMGAQMMGESRHTQLAEGVDNPLLAVATGLSNTALEFRGFQSIYKGLMPEMGTIKNPVDLAKHIAKRATISSGVEGSTEWLQELTNQLAIKMVKPEHDVDWNQLTESFFAGAAAGGGMGTVSGTAGGSYGLMKTIGENVQTRRAMDGTIPEAPIQIQAQLKYITDPNAGLDSVYAADPEAADKVTLPEGVVAYKHESGVLFSSNEAKGKAFEQDGNKDAKSTLGYAETKEEIMATTKAEDLRSVVARNSEGVAVGYEMTSVANAPNVEAAMSERYGKDVDIATLDGPQTTQYLSERQELFNEDIRVRAEERKGLNPEGGQVNTNEAAPAPMEVPADKKGKPAEGAGSKSMRDDAGKLRPLGDLIQEAINGDISQEEIVAEAKKAGVESRPTTKGAFPRQRIINAIIAADKAKREDAGQKAAYSQTQSERSDLEAASNDALAQMAEERGVSIAPENPIVGGAKGAAFQVASALIGKLNNTKGSFIGSSWEKLDFLFDAGTDTKKGKKESSAKYAQRLLLAVKVKEGQLRADAIAEGLSTLSDYQLSELANEFYLNKVKRDTGKIIETTREDDIRQLLADISERESKPAKQQAKVEETTTSKVRSAVNRRNNKRPESGPKEQSQKQRAAVNWETLHNTVRLLMQEQLPKDSDRSMDGLLQVLIGMNWDSKLVRDEIVAQLTELKRFYETNNLNDYVMGKGEKFSTRVDKLIKMANSHKAPNLRKAVNHPDNKRFFDMLSLVFNTRQEDAANKEAAGAAKITLGKLLLRGRIDLTLISDALSKQKGFRRKAFAESYVDRFMLDNATAVFTALDMMSRDSVHSAEKLFEMLKSDMANARGKVNPNFPSMMVNTPMMERYVNSIMQMYSPETRHGMSFVDDIRRIFAYSEGDAAKTIAAMTTSKYINREDRSYYDLAVAEDNHSRPVSANAAGTSPIIETVSQERASINQFFHTMYRATMRFREVFTDVNTPFVVAGEGVVARLAKFKALKPNGSEYLAGKRIITVDFETFFNTETGYSLGNPDLSTEAYITDPQFEILGLAVKEGDTAQYIKTDEEIATLVAGWQKDPNVTLVMHNAQFDAAIFKEKFGYTPNHMIDTMRLSKGIRFEKDARHKLDILSEWMFPDNKDLQKIKDGTKNVDGMKKEDIAASAKKSAQFEEYAIRDVDSTQAIALKLAPLVMADELSHQSAGIINDVTGQVVGTQAERMHNGVFGDKRIVWGPLEAKFTYARAVANNGANLLEVQLEAGKAAAKTVLLDAIAIAKYSDQSSVKSVSEALETLLDNLARMAVGSQPRLQEDLGPTEPDDLRRQYTVPRVIPDSLVIFQEADGTFKTVGDARKANSLQQNEANKDSAIYNFLETAQDTLADKRDQMAALIETLEEEGSEESLIAAEYVKDLMNDAHKNTRKEQDVGGAFNTVETLRSSAIVPDVESEAYLESFAFGSNKPNFDKLQRPSSHISLYEAIQGLSAELIALNKRLKAKSATYLTKESVKKPQDVKFIEGLNTAMERIITERLILREKVRRLVETGHLNDYVSTHSELKGGASEQQHQEIKDAVKTSIEEAGGKKLIDETLALFKQLKEAHAGNLRREKDKSPTSGKDTGTKLTNKPAGDILGDTEQSNRDGLALDADSRFEKLKFLPDPVYSQEEQDAKDEVFDEDADNPESMAADNQMGNAWANNDDPVYEFAAVKTSKNPFDGYVVTPDTTSSTELYNDQDEARRTGVQTLYPRTKGEGYDPSFAAVETADTSYRVYGAPWTDSNLMAKEGQGLPSTRPGPHPTQGKANVATARKALLRRYFTKGVKTFGNLAAVQTTVANLLNAVGIKQNVAITDTSNAATMIKDLAKSGVLTAKEAKNLKARLKASIENKQAAYVNMGEFAIIMMPSSLTNTNAANMSPQTYSMVAHEVGHLVYDFSWANASAKNKASILSEFAADRQNYSEASDSAAFKEWYADQVALSLTQGVLRNKAYITEEDGLNKEKRNRGDLLNVASHFRELVKKLKGLWAVLTKAVRSPFNETFSQYLDGVILRSDVSAQAAPETKGEVLNMAKFRTKKEPITHNKFLKFGHKILGNVSSNFKRLDKNLAALLFQQASTIGSRTGEKSYENFNMELTQRYEALYSTAMKKIGKQKAVRQAFDDLNNNNVTEHSLILRKMINDINADLVGYMPTYQVRNDMIPQAFDHHQVDGKREAFKAMLMQYDVFKQMGDAEMNSRIAYLLDGQGFNERTIAPGKPVGAHAFADSILSAVPYADLKEYLVMEPDAIMSHYIASAAKRASWEHTFGGYVIQDDLTKVARPFGGKWDEGSGRKVWSPNKRWHEAMGRIEKKHGQAGVDEALTLLDGVMGRTGTSMNSKLRKSQDTLLNVVNMNILANSGVASIPELGMAIARSANLLSVKDMFKGLDLREARRIGMDIGTVLSNGLAQIQGNAANEAYNGTITQKMASKYFILNGQQAITKASRTFSTALGMRYIEKAADFNQLEELNAFHVTARQVKTWRALGKPAFTEGLSKIEADSVRAVNGAIMQFVTESSFRPSRFQNPAWGNNPYMKIAFHLKQFLYAITDILVMGLLRQAKRRFSDAKGEGMLSAGAYAMVPIVVGGVAIAGLTMFAMELRELWKGVDRTENMGDTKYAMEVFSKSGTLGAFELGYGVMNAESWDDGLSTLVPTFGFGQGVYNSATGNDSTLETIRRVTPFFSQYKNWWPI